MGGAWPTIVLISRGSAIPTVVRASSPERLTTVNGSISWVSMAKAVTGSCSLALFVSSSMARWPPPQPTAVPL
ncbi:hypothetical protein GCM10010468_45000 [Actinocorallia longicatena]|uniref:Uncharacterized protein n=1 Tax=Actinocorallia longicatena TaxID=111803 RepID=A0ABP6QDU7_9ACTN